MALLLENIRYLLIDMDGVLYRGTTSLPGSGDLLALLEDEGIGYMMVTNNSTMTAQSFVDKLAGMGMDVPPERVVTSASATASYLASCAREGARVNVIGEHGLITELERRGFTITDSDVEYVVAGWDRGVTYDKLSTACVAIRGGATFIGTNPDKTYPLEKVIVPGAGSIQAALVAATDVEPTIVGKPETIMLGQAMQALGASPEETAIIGDRLETDILGGYRAGISTILVLTGISSAQDAQAYGVPVELIVEDLPTLCGQWRRAIASQS